MPFGKEERRENAEAGRRDPEALPGCGEGPCPLPHLGSVLKLGHRGLEGSSGGLGSARPHPRSATRCWAHVKPARSSDCGLQALGLKSLCQVVTTPLLWLCVGVCVSVCVQTSESRTKPLEKSTATPVSHPKSPSFIVGVAHPLEVGEDQRLEGEGPGWWGRGRGLHRHGGCIQKWFLLLLSNRPRSHLDPPDRHNPGELALILASLGLKRIQITIGGVRLLGPVTHSTDRETGACRGLGFWGQYGIHTGSQVA